MDILLSLSGLFAVVVVTLIFRHFYSGGRKRRGREVGLVPLLEEQCGGRFDGFNLTVPFVRHAVYEGFVVVAYGNRHVELSFEDIKSAYRKHHVISDGLHYEHRRKGAPMELIVWSTKGKEVLELLENHGVAVAA